MKAGTWRKIHRWLGLVIGIQLLLWTVSGLIFSWNSIAAVRGETMIRTPDHVDLRTCQFADLNSMLAAASTAEEFGGQVPVSVALRSMLDRPVYEVTLKNRMVPDFFLLDALTGDRISPIDQETAGRIAVADFSGPATAKNVQLVESTSSHSEYRGKELPAWRVELDDPDSTIIYVSANRGVVTARRNDRWRMFDFFWMLHTMDYQGRDNFNHWLLKGVSAFGVVTVLSGFVLFFKTSRWFRRRISPASPTNGMGGNSSASNPLANRPDQT